MFRRDVGKKKETLLAVIMGASAAMLLAQSSMEKEINDVFGVRGYIKNVPVVN